MHKGIQSTKPIPTNKVAKTFDTSNQRAGEPKDEQLRISYGTIVEVNEDNNKVRVDIFGRQGKRIRIGSSEKKKDGLFVPVMQPLSLIHFLFGTLRKGLVVRVFWRGKHTPGSESLVEVVSDVESAKFSSGSEEPRSNELATGPHDIFTGGTNFRSKHV